ncbi:MAG: hypothetical protein M1480_02645 [Bacteroidetes bacterium]|nr:hypothetical protein [Bacteroidota bacterium]
MEYLDLISSDYKIFLQFLKAKYPMFHNSNFFFRDLQFGIVKFLENKGIKIQFGEAEILAKRIGTFLEHEGIFIKVNQNGWRLNYPEFVMSVPDKS